MNPPSENGSITAVIWYAPAAKEPTKVVLKFVSHCCCDSAEPVIETLNGRTIILPSSLISSHIVTSVTPDCPVRPIVPDTFQGPVTEPVLGVIVKSPT